MIVKSRTLEPDTLSWLVKPFVDFAEDFVNEDGYSLWSSLLEYSEHCGKVCVITGSENVNDLVLYPEFSFDLKDKVAKLERMYWVTREVCNLMMCCFLPSEIKQPKSKFFQKDEVLKGSVERFRDIELFVQHNNLLPEVAKGILLKTSYRRYLSQKSLFFELHCETRGNTFLCKYDLSWLYKSKFFTARKFASYQQILPPTLLTEILVQLNIVVSNIPQSLKEEQMIKED